MISALNFMNKYACFGFVEYCNNALQIAPPKHKLANSSKTALKSLIKFQ
jgi:hypothetical protein